MQGYIKDYRQEIKSDIWKMPPLYHRTWQWLKYNVNHEDTEIPMRDGSKMLIKKGQRLTSVRDIAKEIGWYEGYKWKEPNPKTIYTILDWMESQGMISISRGKGNRQYTLITLLNWGIYQAKEIQGNSSETVGKHLADINKNDNNDNNLEDDDYRSPISQIENHFCMKRGRGLHVSPDDIRIMREMLDYGIPVPFIINSIDRQFDSFKPKHAKDFIRTFSYCESGIYQDWENYQQRKAGERSEVSPVRSGIDQAESSKPQKSGWIRTAGNAELQDRLRAVQ